MIAKITVAIASKTFSSSLKNDFFSSVIPFPFLDLLGLSSGYVNEMW